MDFLYDASAGMMPHGVVFASPEQYTLPESLCLMETNAQVAAVSISCATYVKEKC